jgi:dTDP-4-dehydrorhamnose 3,5-epimerase
MLFTETKLKGAFIIDLQKLEDERGFFARSWCQREFEAHGLNPQLVQCNISFSLKKGTLRGMHYQAKPFEEAKLVRCVRGSIYDVIIDIRPDSPTYCQWIAVELSSPRFHLPSPISLLPTQGLGSAADCSPLTAHSSEVTAHSLQLTAHTSEVTAGRSPLTAYYKMVYVPEGFAHGFLTLEDNTEVFYQMSEFFAPEYARGFRWNDPAFGIRWPLEPQVISERDRTYPDFAFKGAANEGRWKREE